MTRHALTASLALALIGTVAPAAAHVEIFTATLSGADEFPATASAGTGTATITVDQDLLTMRVQFSFSGLTGNATAAHIHCCTPDGLGRPLAGVATETPSFVGFPSGPTVKSGTYDHTYDLAARATYNPSSATTAFFQAFGGGTIDGAKNALIEGMRNGTAYLNIHTTAVGSGEIRGFLHPAPVPEPETYALMAAGLGLVGWMAAKRRGVRI